MYKVQPSKFTNAQGQPCFGIVSPQGNELAVMQNREDADALAAKWNATEAQSHCEVCDKKAATTVASLWFGQHDGQCTLYVCAQCLNKAARK
jgi:hypothetical protein